MISIFSVTLVTIYGQTRILFAMGRDGMIPPLFHRVNPRTRTPVPATIFAALVIGLLAGLLPIDFLAEMTSIGTLVAFLIVSIGVIVLRQMPRPAARLQGAGLSRHADPLDRRVHLDHPGPACRDDLRLLRLGRRGAALVLLLRPQPCPPRACRGGERGHVMTMLVGIAPDGPGKAVLHLAGMLARSAGDDLLLCSVVPQSWPPGPARVDAEYQAYLESTATEVLERARERLDQDITARLVVHHARSAPAGLVEAAEQHAARMIIVGSSSAGAFGHVSLGSVSGRLLHSSPVPVALTPRGHRCEAGSQVDRVTAAFSGPEGADDLVVAAAAVAAQVGASLRIASFAVRSRPPYTSGVGSSADQAIISSGARRSRRPRARRSRRSPTSRPCRRTSRPSSGAARAGARRSTTSSGSRVTCSWSAPAPSGRSRGSSWAHARPRSSSTPPSRSCWFPAARAAELAEEAQAA